MRAIIFSVLALALLGACGNPDRPLHAFPPSGGGPDEFSVIPKLPLGTPPTNELPLPTPGGSNRTDVNPNADAIAALGGSASAQVAGGIPAGDAALIAQTGRYGVEPRIRAELAAADEAFRNRRSRSNILNPLNRDRYFPAYARQALNANAELARLQAAGVAVPDPTFVRPLPPRRTTLPTPPADQPQAAPVEAAEEPQGLLQRTVQGLLPRNRQTVCSPLQDLAINCAAFARRPMQNWKRRHPNKHNPLISHRPYLPKLRCQPRNSMDCYKERYKAYCRVTVETVCSPQKDLAISSAEFAHRSIQKWNKVTR